MKNRTYIPILLSVVLILGAILACNLPGISQLQQAQQGLATGESIVKTVQPALSQVPGMMETASSLTTLMPTDMSGLTQGKVPDDIPVIDPHNNDLIATEASVSYTTSKSYKDTVAFYKTAMLDKQWKAVATGSFETPLSSALNYEKTGRTALVSITPTGNTVTVAIVITSK